MFLSLCSTSAFEIDLYNSRGEPGWLQQTPTRCMLTTWWSLLEQIIVHPLKQLFSIRGTAAHSGSVVMQVLAISSITKGHLVKHVLVHPLKHSPSLTGTGAHSGSVVMQVLAISSVTKGHPTIHKNRVPITGTCLILF